MTGKGDKRIPGEGYSRGWEAIYGAKVETCLCGSQEIAHLPPDGLSFCDECDHIVEGQTTMQPRKEDD